MQEKYTNPLKKAIIDAQNKAVNLNNETLTPLHMLYGILEGDDTGGAKRVLLQLLNQEELQQMVVAVNEKLEESREDSSSDSSVAAVRAYDAHLSAVLQDTLRESIVFNESKMGTDFFLLALAGSANRDKRVIEIFRNFRINAVAINATIHKLLADEAKHAKENTAAESVRRSSSAVQNDRVNADKKLRTLAQYSTNLTEKAQNGILDPVIGREDEVLRIMEILTRRNKNNPILIGEPGVGKTAIIEGLAQMLLTKEAPKALRGKQIYSLELSSAIAGSRYRGDFEERIQKIVKEVQADGNILLFIDEIHNIIGAGSAEGAMDVSNIMKPLLSRGELSVVGATTYEEYRKYFEKDAALVRRFQKINVNEPSEEDTVKILQGLRKKYENHHQIQITDEAIKAAVEYSSRYMPSLFFPDKALDLIDEASSAAKLKLGIRNPELASLYATLNKFTQFKEEAFQNQDFASAGEYRKQAEDVKEKIVEMENAQSANETIIPSLGKKDIAQVITRATGIPVDKITEKESERLRTMEGILSQRLIGQKEALKSVSKAVRRQRAGLKDPNRPAGSFIFAGPTGTGKTELAKALGEFMFNDEKSVITIDMSEYGEKHTVSRLFGAAPGFVGYEEGGQLTKAVEKKPFSIILLDEIEKAHDEVFNSLLQVLEEGRLTDGQGKIVDFKNTVIIMTTNLGAKDIKGGGIGFSSKAHDNVYDRMKQKVEQELKNKFRPEFLNRIDDTVVFAHLDKTEIEQIVDIFMTRVNDRLIAHDSTLVLTPAAKTAVAKKGWDQDLGARPLRRAIQNLLEDPLSEMILFDCLPQGEIEVGWDSEKEEVLFNNLPLESHLTPNATTPVTSNKIEVTGNTETSETLVVA